MNLTARRQRGAVLAEATIALPVFLMLVFLTFSVSFAALEKSRVESALQSTVRRLSLVEGGACNQVAAMLLREEIPTLDPVSLNIQSQRTGDTIFIRFRVMLGHMNTNNFANLSNSILFKQFKIKVENPVGCYAEESNI